MNMETTERKNIFLIPIGDYLNTKIDDYYLVYAPLASKMLVADKDGLNQLHSILPELIVEGDMNRFFSKVNKASDLQKMSVLPNHICNFNCSYCYSAQGRDHITLNQEALDRA